MDQKSVEQWIESGTGRRLHCGDGVYLCRNKRGFSWAYIWMKEGRRRELGLGAYGPAMRLREARWAAARPDDIRREGRDVIREVRREDKELAAERVTFGEVAETYVTDVGSRTWKHEKQAAEFRRIVRVYCAKLVDMEIREIGVSDVVACVKPWVSKRPTMARTIGSVIRRVIDTAFALELRPLGVNPAAEDVLSKVLVVRHETTHFASADWRDVPAIYAGLGDTIPQQAIKLLMLTALRRGEVLGLMWTEVDFDHCLLKIGAKRMKSDREHIVPLSREACELLRRWHNRGGRYVFPAVKDRQRSLSAAMIHGILPKGSTVHGLRATFRTWCDDTGVDPQLAEFALAHALPDAVAKAYRRSTAIERRRELMQAWADHLTASALADAA